MIPAIDSEVLSVLCDLVDRVVQETDGDQRPDELGVLDQDLFENAEPPTKEPSVSPPSDLFESVGLTFAKPVTNLEFFSDMLDVLPTQFNGMSQFGKTPVHGPSQFGQTQIHGTSQFGQTQIHGTSQFGQIQFHGPNQFAQTQVRGLSQVCQTGFHRSLIEESADINTQSSNVECVKSPPISKIPKEITLFGDDQFKFAEFKMPCQPTQVHSCPRRSIRIGLSRSARRFKAVAVREQMKSREE